MLNLFSNFQEQCVVLLLSHQCLITSVFEAPVDISVVSGFFRFPFVSSSVLVFLKIFEFVPNIVFAKYVVEIWSSGFPPGRTYVAFARNSKFMLPNCTDGDDEKRNCLPSFPLPVGMHLFRSQP